MEVEAIKGAGDRPLSRAGSPAVYDCESQEFHCPGCGARYRPALPCPLVMFAAMCGAFAEMHDACRAKGEQA